MVRGDTWHLRDSLSGGGADTTFDFGDPSDLPLMGDWDGDGSETPGVFRDGTFILSNTLGESGAFTVHFGRPGDVPIAGDWDADDDDDLGVMRGGRWYLDLGLTGGPAEREFWYGRASDTPLAGDWDGDGYDTPGVMRGKWWYLENDLDPDGRASTSFAYGKATDRPLVGRWNGGSHDHVGVVRGKRWYLKHELSGGPADRTFPYGYVWDRKLTWGEAATGQAAPDTPQRTYRYHVGTKGGANGDVDTFARIANLTLSYGLGWTLDFEIRFVETGDLDAADFRLWLTDGDDVGEQAPTCSDQYSCTVGDDIYINDERWNRATATWDHRSLRAYRMYVINHEVGHWLGLDHYNDDDDCRDVDGDGRAEAPVMMQQSIDLRGCATNVWPLPFEERLVRDRHVS